MPYNLLLLPLLGGYWLITFSTVFRFKYIQLDRTHLLLWSATAGIILVAVARLICIFTIWFIPQWVEAAKRLLMPWDFAGTSLLALLLGPLIAWVLNKLLAGNSKKRDRLSQIAIIKHGDQLEKFLVDAQKHGKLLFFSLKSAKVYVAYLSTAPADMERRDAWLSVIPLYSGYRDPADKHIEFVTDYSDILNKTGDRDSYQKLIRSDDIEICSIFEQSAWDGFNNDDDDADEFNQDNGSVD